MNHHNITGTTIARLRKELHLTQKELADQMGISDKAVSKWETGMGLPEVSLWQDLAGILNINMEQLFSGIMEENKCSAQNLKTISFYLCPNCKCATFSTSSMEHSCCGRKLHSLPMMKKTDENKCHIEKTGDEYYVLIDHEMSKEHYIPFIACVGYDRILFINLYPEQNAEIRIPVMRGAQLYICCSQHGLAKVTL